jgi:hypothetical protein
MIEIDALALFHDVLVTFEADADGAFNTKNNSLRGMLLLPCAAKARHSKK